MNKIYTNFCYIMPNNAYLCNEDILKAPLTYHLCGN